MSIEVYYINAFSERTVTYDRNGNILSLTRYGADTAVPEEALAYSYDGDLLSGVSNSGSSGGGGAYTHDANGNLTRDGLSCLDIEYDDLNLTSRVSSGDTTLAVYGHLADGTKIRSVDGTGNGLQYRGSLVYTQTAGQSGSPILILDCALTSAGRIVRWTAADGSVSYRSLIHLRDHLGSVRAVVDGDTGTVIEASDYYPFGKRIPTVTEPVAPTSPNRWHFSGKESQSFLSAAIPLLDFGARMYDPLTARWTAQDPLAEKYYAVSPHAYCLGNPISLFDPNGTDVWTVDAFGNVVWKEQSDTHCLYYVDNEGNLSEVYVTVSDISILDDLTKTEVKTDGGAEVSSHSSKTGINDMFKVFKFASDKTKVEWAIHRNGDSYTIGTGHKTDNAASWEDYVGAMPNATVHSHPGTWQDMADEINSMGYGSAFYNTDQTHAKQEIDKYGSKARINYVYFPVSRRLYKVGYYNASFIRNIKNHKGFYFGTLNKK